MPFDAAGAYQRTHNWQADASNDINILASRMDTEFNGVVDAINSILLGERPIRGQLKVEFGSETAPGYTFVNDEDSGIYRSGVDTLSISVAGKEVIRVSEDRFQFLGNDLLTTGDGVNSVRTLTDPEIGGVAFRNPPTDLSSAEVIDLANFLVAIIGNAGKPNAQAFTKFILDNLPTNLTLEQQLAFRDVFGLNDLAGFVDDDNIDTAFAQSRHSAPSRRATVEFVQNYVATYGGGGRGPKQTDPGDVELGNGKILLKLNLSMINSALVGRIRAPRTPIDFRLGVSSVDPDAITAPRSDLDFNMSAAFGPGNAIVGPRSELDFDLGLAALVVRDSFVTADGSAFTSPRVDWELDLAMELIQRTPETAPRSGLGFELSLINSHALIDAVTSPRDEFTDINLGISTVQPQIVRPN